MRKILIAFGFIALAFGVTVLRSLLGALVLMLAWNAVGHGLFNGPTITYWQGVGVSFLLWIVGSYFKGGNK